MFHVVSWTTYLLGILLLTLFYYLFVGITFYRKELISSIRRLSGHPQTATNRSVTLPEPEYQIMGDAQEGPAQVIDSEEFSFGPSEIPDDTDGSSLPEQAGTADEVNAHLEQEYRAMKEEVKTLVSVIIDGNESQESFRMLFVLIAQKYPDIRNSPYQEIISSLLFQELQGRAGFELGQEDLQAYWNDSLTPQNA